ncbi:hypothetical protein HZF02_01755 [Pseudomonas yamanorum]|nr:hypothetical protein HZF02_01755 [Pseudomonas yamanorum]
MSGSFQSHDYVPGMSGLKIDLKTGEFEINSCTLGSAAKAPERQMVSVEVASWSKYDLPKNAANLLQFMQAELQKVPEPYRHAAEFEEFDASYGDESFNTRLFLSYSRLETEEELVDRLEKAKVAGTRFSLVNGALTITHDGVTRVRIGNLTKSEQSEPFNASVESKVDAPGAVRTALLKDKHVMSGLGLGMCTGGYTGDGPKVVAAMKDAIGGEDGGGLTGYEKAVANGTTDQYFAEVIGKTSLYRSLREEIDQIAKLGQVNQHLDELKEKQGAENRAVAERLDSLATKICELHALIIKRT